VLRDQRRLLALVAMLVAASFTLFILVTGADVLSIITALAC